VFCENAANPPIQHYYPQVSFAQRVIRNFNSSFKIFHHQTQNTWVEDIPLLAFALNTAVHERNQTIPDLFLEREIKSPLGSRWDLLSLEIDDKSAVSQSPWARTFKYLNSANRKVERRFNEGRKTYPFSVEDTVNYRKNLVSN